MNELVLPETVVTQLAGLPHPVHLCDSSGKTLGYFVPLVDPSAYAIDVPEPGAEELRRIEQSADWFSTGDVLRHLEQQR